MTGIKVRILKERIKGRKGWMKSATSDIAVDELNSRTPFSPNSLEKLRNSRVGIVGLGSGGSKVAVDLAKANVGEFVLIDPARFQAHNASRHVATLLDVGRYKVDAVSDQMLLHNPYIKIQAYAVDCWHPESKVSFNQLIAGCNLVVAATDQTEVQLAINETTWSMKIPTIFGGCYETAKGGEIFYTLPEEGTPCLACLRAGFLPKKEAGPFAYSSAVSTEDFQGEPGLGTAVDLVTDVEAHIALAILLQGTGASLAQLISPQFNFLLVGGALAAGYYRFKRPFQIFWQPLAGRRPDCDVCQPISQTTIPDFDHLDIDFSVPGLD
jgi:molybdopterin/thiamine biosynthesis adenylyltransferase